MLVIKSVCTFIILYVLLPIDYSTISRYYQYTCYRFVSAANTNLFYFDVCVSRMDLPIGLMPDTLWTYVCNSNRFADNNNDHNIRCTSVWYQSARGPHKFVYLHMCLVLEAILVAIYRSTRFRLKSNNFTIQTSNLRFEFRH